MTSDIFVYGASGHAKVVIDAIERMGGFTIAALIDDNPALHGREFFGYRVAGGREALLDLRRSTGLCRGIVAIGDNAIRAKLAAWLAQEGLQRIVAVHPAACVGRGVDIGSGTVIMAGCVVNSDTLIGEDVIVNTGATVDHDCSVGSCVHIAPGCHLCGNVSIGDGTLVGAGSTLIPGVTVGSHAVIGAGSTVIGDIAGGATVAGCPARPLRRDA